jgi:hypothetical protein
VVPAARMALVETKKLWMVNLEMLNRYWLLR